MDILKIVARLLLIVGVLAALIIILLSLVAIAADRQASEDVPPGELVEPYGVVLGGFLLICGLPLALILVGVGGVLEIIYRRRKARRDTDYNEERD